MSLFGIGLPAVVELASGIAGSIMKTNSAEKQTRLQAQLQRENWEYAQKNAHQFEVDDLKSAGLNPILSATNSQLASMPSVGGSSAENPLAGVSDMVARAQELAEKKALRLQDFQQKNHQQKA